MQKYHSLSGRNSDMLCSNVDLCMPTVCATIESNFSEIFQPTLIEANKMFDVIF